MLTQLLRQINNFFHKKPIKLLSYSDYNRNCRTNKAYKVYTLLKITFYERKISNKDNILCKVRHIQGSCAKFHFI